MRRMYGGGVRPLIGIVAAVVGLVLPLSGCGVGEPETNISPPKESEQDQNAPEPEGDATSTPDDTAAPDMPPLPPAAEEKTDDGAAAFAEYYIDLWQRSEKEDHFDELGQYMDNCDDSCGNMSGPAAGHYEEGGEWEILDSVAKKSAQDRWNASVTFTIKAGTWVYHTPEAKPEKQELQDLIASMELKYREGKWELLSIGFG